MDNDKDEEEHENSKEVHTTFPVGLDYKWTEEIVAVVNSNYTAVFGEMTELMCSEARHTNYPVKLFLCTMGGYFYPSVSKEWIEQTLVHKYVLSLVPLGVKEVLHLIGSVTVINKLLLDTGWETFTEKMLVYICAIGTVDPGRIWVVYARREGICQVLVLH
jgi:hypothetical protein